MARVGEAGGMEETIWSFRLRLPSGLRQRDRAFGPGLFMARLKPCPSGLGPGCSGAEERDDNALSTGNSDRGQLDERLKFREGAVLDNYLSEVEV